MNSIADFEDFFRRYKVIEQDAFSDFATFFARVHSRWPALKEAAQQEAMTLAPGFNIFRALDIERKEDVLHTPMLAYLLSPSGQHGQGGVFLSQFFEALRKHDRSMPDARSLDDRHWMIQQEFYIGAGGIVDVLIENVRKKYVVVVENKIDTDDHHDQIPRYYKWLEQRRRDYVWRQLVYLTPDGRAATSCRGCEYLRLSYKRDIVRFLKAASKHIQAQPVQEIVKQYLAVLEGWTEDNDDEAS